MIGRILVALSALAAGAASALPAPAAAQGARQPLPRLSGRVLLAGCRQGECGWTRVVRIARERVVPQGELRRLMARRGTSVHGVMNDPPARYSPRLRVAWDPADRSEYAFCSRARPAYAFPDDDGGYILHYLDLFDVAGYQTSSVALYMQVCHGMDPPRPGRLRAMGYRPGTRSEQVERGRPGDLASF